MNNMSINFRQIQEHSNIKDNFIYVIFIFNEFGRWELAAINNDFYLANKIMMNLYNENNGVIIYKYIIGELFERKDINIVARIGVYL